MDRNESSVTSSLKQLMLEEEHCRAEHLALAHRRKLEQQRETLKEQMQRSEQERHLAELAKREAIQRAEERRAEQERAERERLAELERVRVESELRAKTAVMKLEQQHCLERLAIERDVRVRQLDGHRTILAALLGTIVLGALMLYGLLLHPESRQKERLFAQLSESNAAQRAKHERERSSMTRRSNDLEARLADVQSKLDAERKKSASREPQLALRHNPKPPQGPKVQTRAPRCDDNDPLCGDIGSR